MEINKRSDDVERSKLGVTKKEMKMEKNDLYRRGNMRIDKIFLSSAEYRIDKQLQNCQIVDL